MCSEAARGARRARAVTAGRGYTRSFSHLGFPVSEPLKARFTGITPPAKSTARHWRANISEQRIPVVAATRKTV